MTDKGNGEMAKEKTATITKHLLTLGSISALVFILIFWTLPSMWASQTQTTHQSLSYQVASQAVNKTQSEPPLMEDPDQSMEKRIEKIEQTLESIRVTGEKAEDRSYFNKLMSRELIRYVRIMVIVLIVIAIAFPLTLWLLSRKRLLALSGLSDEVTATLLLVEERQAKLANLLREIQMEIDYMENMSAPDLKKLIEQAEKYLKQNEKDLRETGARVQKSTVD